MWVLMFDISADLRKSAKFNTCKNSNAPHFLASECKQVECMTICDFRSCAILGSLWNIRLDLKESLQRITGLLDGTTVLTPEDPFEQIYTD